MFWLLVLVFALVVWFTVSSSKRPKNYPPGPWRIPVVGQAMAIDHRQPHKTFDRWAAEFGPVYSVKLGVQEMVVLSSPQIFREAFNKPEISSRPSLIIFTIPSKGNFGLLGSNGSLWKENRRFSLRQLRDLGVGKSTIENSVRDEIKEFTEQEFLSNLGQPLDVSGNLNVSITNIIWGVVAGKRLSYGDKKIKYFINVIDNNLKTMIKVAILDYLPWLRPVAPESMFPVKSFANTARDFHSYSRELLEEHKRDYDESILRDYIDCYIKQINEDKDKLHPNFFDWQMICTLGDLFVAGGETTATSIRWALLFLCLHPENQDRIQAEIDEVVGKCRMPEYKDRESMPYTEAFIAETQRLGTVAPQGVVHVTSQDTTVAGYNIPKGTLVSALLYRVHRDPSLWKDPDQFLPKRFLDDQGRFVKDENLMPFLVGRRQCPGEVLARVELFLFLTSFLQLFRFKLADGEIVDSEPSTEPRFVVEPKPFRMVVTSREE